LSRAHFFQLRLFEIGGHPNVIEGHDLQHFLANAHVLTDFNALLSNNSRHRRANDGVAEIELCLGQLSTALLDQRVRCVCVRTDERHLLRRGLGASKICLGLQEFPFRLAHTLFGALDSGVGRSNCRPVCCC